MNETILIIDGDADVAKTVATALRAECYEPQIASDAPTGLALANSLNPDMIILDTALPGFSGTEFIRRVREKSGVAIIVLSAKSEEIDKVVALELGADDYVTKPFSTRELLGRIKAVFRRVKMTTPPEQTQTHLRGSGIDLDTARRTVTVDGNEVHLPFKQFELLRLLMANKHRTLTREELIKGVWGPEANEGTGSLDVHVRWLREKVEADPDKPVRIRTVRGVGHRFVDVDEG